MNQSELFHLWATGQIKCETIVGTVHALPHRMYYGPMGASLALRHNGMVLVSSVTRTGNIPRAVINTHRTKLYDACDMARVEFNPAISTLVPKRPFHPSSLFVIRSYIDGLISGQTPDFFQLHETYGYTLSAGNPDQWVLTRYRFVCRMLGTDPIYNTIEEMVEWHRCVSILSPQ